MSERLTFDRPWLFARCANPTKSANFYPPATLPALEQRDGL